jgi:hypothetical protein
MIFSANWKRNSGEVENAVYDSLILPGGMQRGREIKREPAASWGGAGTSLDINLKIIKYPCLRPGGVM